MSSPLNVPDWRDFPLRRVRRRSRGRRGQRASRCSWRSMGSRSRWPSTGSAPPADIDNVMGMVISTGIGGGLILDGRVITGPTGNAGHIGHVEVGGFTGESTFGATSSLEAIASGPHTVAWARREGFQGTTGEDLARAYAAGDPVALAAIKRTGTAVGHAIGARPRCWTLSLLRSVVDSPGRPPISSPQSARPSKRTISSSSGRCGSSHPDSPETAR